MERSNITVELTCGGEKIDAFVRSMRTYGLLELVRTGTIAIMRSDS